MRFLIVADSLLIVASSIGALVTCGGLSQQQVIETPIAESKYVSGEAPPASADDKERERLIRQFDEMWVTQRAYEQAREEGREVPPPPPKAAPAPAPAEITPPPSVPAPAKPPKQPRS